MNPLSEARRRANDALFARVAGPEGRAAQERIHRTPGPRWFPPGSPIRRVHGDASMYLGGVRALLLQSLHPLAMAAVADHSGFRGDPWGRLARTSTFVAQTTFATAEDAERAVAIVRAVHGRISGTAPDGRPYRADDPHLLTWVHVAEIDSFLLAHQQYGTTALTAPEQDEYVAQAATVARRLGGADVPTTKQELDSTIDRYRTELEATTAALDTTRFLLKQPPVPVLLRPPYGVLTSAGVDLLPGWAREQLGLQGRLPRPVAGALALLGGKAMVGGLRWLAAAQPVPFVDEEQKTPTQPSR